MSEPKDLKPGSVQLVDELPKPELIPQATSLTPGQMLSTLVQQGADPAILEKFMGLQERWEANEAKKAYDQDMTRFKKESIVILKNKQVGFDTSAGRTEYSHASLDHVLDVTVPVLAKHGFTHKWLITEENTLIIVECVLTHKKGHSESTFFSGTADVSGKKNPIQAKASTVTYLERYTFLAITGLAAKDQDDDGVGSQPEEVELVSVDQVNTINTLISDNKLDLKAFLKYIKKETIESIPALSFDWCVEQIQFAAKKHQDKASK